VGVTGWNCEWVEGSTRSSFHSALNSLKGLLASDATTGATDATREARHVGSEYLLQRKLWHRLSTVNRSAPGSTGSPTPFRWTYSALNATDYFRQAALFDGAKPDSRMSEAIEMIRTARQPDARWLQAGRQPGRGWFETDAPAGEPSKWLILIGTRVLDWWDSESSR
jgi:hypothetical protein